MNPKTSQDLFNKIRSQFSNIKIGDENGQATADPEKAVFFEFEWQPDSDTFGSVSISIADDENMKVFYNRDLVEKIDESDRDEWYAFLKELKDFAVEHSLRFDVRDITKSNLTKQDYQNIADTNKTVNTDEMSEELARITKLAGVNEGLTGTSKSSFENLDKTKLIIRHKGKVDETVPGARSRQIQSLYIENEAGERFKYPMTHLAGARAMTRHVANGGTPYDEFGEHIIQTSEDIAKLQSFSRYVSNKDQLNDSAGDIIENTKLQLENLRTYMRNLSKQSHYESSCKSYKKSEAIELDDETANSYKDKFTLKNLDSKVEDALPLIHKIMSELELKDLKPKASDVVTIGKGGSLKHIQIEYEILGTLENMLIDNSEQEVLKRIADFVTDEVGAEHVDKAMEIIEKAKENKDEEMTFDDMIQQLKGEEGEAEKSSRDKHQGRVDVHSHMDDDEKKEDQVNELEPDEEPIDAPIEPPVDHGAIVQSFLTDPENKLILRKDDTADKMLSNTTFKNKNTMLGSILSDIASRMLTKTGEEDRVANFASRVADNLDMENSASFKPDADYMKNKKIAIQLAKRYIDDYNKMKKDPAYADEVRMDPEAFNPKKHPKLAKRARGEAQEFEEWAESVVNEGGVKRQMEDDAEKMSKEEFVQKYGKDMADFWHSFNGVEEYATEPKNPEDREAKLKAIQDIQMDPNTSKDPEMMDMVAKRKKELMKEPVAAEDINDDSAQVAKDQYEKNKDLQANYKSWEDYMKSDEFEEYKSHMKSKFEGNQFAQAVQKAKAAGMKAGDKFKVGDQEYTLKDAIELAGLQLDEFFSEEEQAYDDQIDRIKNLAFYQ